MYDTLVVALDLEPDGDRALEVVRALALSSAVRVELVTVSSPGIPIASDAYELANRAVSVGRDRAAWTILHDNDVPGALLRHMVHHDRGLLVMATSARRPWPSRLSGSVAGELLSRADRPILLVGPDVDWTETPPYTTLVPCIAESGDAERALVAIESWHRTFLGPAPHLAEVVAPTPENAGTTTELERLADLLAAQHVPTVRHAVTAADPVSGLEALTSGFIGPVYVTSSTRYCDGRWHWHSTTQQLVREASGPVLVVPPRPQPLTAPADPRAPEVAAPMLRPAVAGE